MVYIRKSHQWRSIRERKRAEMKRQKCVKKRLMQEKRHPAFNDTLIYQNTKVTFFMTLTNINKHSFRYRLPPTSTAKPNSMIQKPWSSPWKYMYTVDTMFFFTSWYVRLWISPFIKGIVHHIIFQLSMSRPDISEKDQNGVLKQNTSTICTTVFQQKKSWQSIKKLTA